MQLPYTQRGADSNWAQTQIWWLKSGESNLATQTQIWWLKTQIWWLKSGDSNLDDSKLKSDDSNLRHSNSNLVTQNSNLVTRIRLTRIESKLKLKNVTRLKLKSNPFREHVWNRWLKLSSPPSVTNLTIDVRLSGEFNNPAFQWQFMGVVQGMSDWESV